MKDFEENLLNNNVIILKEFLPKKKRDTLANHK
jgi:hypothetical protein